MNRNVILVTAVAIIISACPHIVSALVILDPAYSAQEYKIYPIENGWQSGMTFDSSGNLYITHNVNGSIYKTSPDGTTTEFANGLDVPHKIVWAGGTEYGNNLYVTETSDAFNPGKLTKFDVVGNRETVCHINYEPLSLGLDRTGNYNNKLYLGTNVHDRIITVNPSGTTDAFSDFPYNLSGGGPHDIEFDPGVDYGGLMYVATYSNTNPQLAGIFSLDINGNHDRFAPDIVNAAGLEFDTGGLFDNELIIRGMLSDDTSWTIYSSDPGGQISPLAQGSWGHIFAMTMGPDGALYVAEYDNGLSVITRIVYVPEPASLALLALGAVRLLRRRKSIC